MLANHDFITFAWLEKFMQPGDIAQPAKCLSYRQEYLSSTLRTDVNTEYIVVCL